MLCKYQSGGIQQSDIGLCGPAWPHAYRACFGFFLIELAIFNDRASTHVSRVAQRRQTTKRKQKKTKQQKYFTY